MSVSKVNVTVDRRKFCVHFEEGAPRRVMERVLRNEGRPWAAYSNVSRWHADHNARPKPAFLLARVIAAAEGEVARAL